MDISIFEINQILGKSQTRKSIIGNPAAHIDCLITDSRSFPAGKSPLFFAINNPGGHDGHDFIEDLYKRGTRNFVVEDLPQTLTDKDDCNIIFTDNSINALGEVSKIKQKNASKVTAITGSRGKTTLKEWIYHLMEPLGEIYRSPRSYNSKIGVPLSMWGIVPDTDLAIIEAGISKTGEMGHLSDIIHPDTVIITNIGEAHADGFRDLQEKANEKALLAATPNVRNIIYNKDSELISKAILPYSTGKNIITWSLTDDKANVFIERISDGMPMHLAYTWQGERHELQIPAAEHDFDIENAGLALSFMLNEGIDHKTIKERFGNLSKIGTRLNVTDGINGSLLILDSYTGDMSSLIPALNFMSHRKTASQKSTVIMKDIRHEIKDKNTERVYKLIAETISFYKIDKFIGIGKEISKYKNFFNQDSIFFNDINQLMQSVNASDFSEKIVLLKGLEGQEMAKIKDLLEARKHETVLEVNLDSITANYNYFRSKLPYGIGIIAMVKASGYGAGSYEIAKTLQECGAAYLAVAVIDEGTSLRRRGIRMPIMVMNPKSSGYAPLFTYNLEPSVYSLEMLKEIIIEAEKNGQADFPIHIKLDTGMHRMGFLPNEIEAVTGLLKKQNAIRVSSIFSHLATADCTDMDEYTLRQINNFETMSQKLASAFPYQIKRHILNTAGILRFPEYHYDMVRLGIGLYGANTLPPKDERELATVCHLRTVITDIRQLEAGETVGYGRKGVLTRNSRIATLPIGYADGMNRHLGNGKIYVKINGKEAPTIGNICMDACMIDVTDVECHTGDTVEIFGSEAPLQRIADALDTIPYEVLTSVSPRVKRIYYRE